MSNLPQYPQYPQHSAAPPSPGSIGNTPMYQPYPAPYGTPADMGSMAAPFGLADLGSRLGARVLDLVLWYVGYMATGGIWLSMWIDAGGGSTARTLLLIWVVASGVLYYPLCIGKYGSTLGKRICKVRIVRRETGQTIGFWRALSREVFWPVASIIPVLGLLNSLWCCWDKPYQQCLHDKVADTMAVAR
ncbi:RDD family protein [Streptomyces violascens]|uniref:RDD family protein n=1 Tax=Streptomyces violascens TaxID=67381 RepID=UPI0016763831|nr:RDD family protein [Streptomyces violascens]GGU40449.1 hypothetical protein GCM10010289_71600 [Streptomyces violascens]